MAAISSPTSVSAALPFDRPLDLARMRRERHGRLTESMRTVGVDVCVLLGGGNVAYATGARVPAADQSRALHRRSVAVVTADGAPPHLYTWHPGGAPPELPAEHVHRGLDLDRAEDAETLVRTLPGGALAADEVTMPLRAALAAAGRPVRDATVVVAGAKYTKTADEIECTRRAQAINEAAIAHVRSLAVPGARTAELSGAFLRRIGELGATGNTVDPIWQVMPPRVADGPRSLTGDVVFPTAPVDRVLEKGDVVWVDNGIAYHGYQSDYGHTWVIGVDDVGPVKRDQCARWRSLVEALVAAIKPGVTARDLTRLAVEHIGTGARPWLPHLYLGHGTGTDSAEAPLLGTDLGDAVDAATVLAPGTVVVLEPVIWDDGESGFRAEEIVAVTEDGAELLSSLSFEEYE